MFNISAAGAVYREYVNIQKISGVLLFLFVSGGFLIEIWRPRGPGGI